MFALRTRAVVRDAVVAAVVSAVGVLMFRTREFGPAEIRAVVNKMETARKENSKKKKASLQAYITPQERYKQQRDELRKLKEKGVNVACQNPAITHMPFSTVRTVCACRVFFHCCWFAIVRLRSRASVSKCGERFKLPETPR